jgi:hypothetical protein
MIPGMAPSALSASEAESILWRLRTAHQPKRAPETRAVICPSCRKENDDNGGNFCEFRKKKTYIVLTSWGR